MFLIMINECNKLYLQTDSLNGNIIKDIFVKDIFIKNIFIRYIIHLVKDMFVKDIFT